MKLSAEKISVTLGGKEILHDVSCDFSAGKRTAIIGANGAGKSTLLKILCLLNEKFSGTVKLDGKDIRTLGRKNLSRVMAILPQERDAPQDTTVRQLVSFGRFPHRKFFGGESAEDIAAISNALELTRLTDFESRQVASLSGGERQRAWLAMTLAQRPKILLLDEPTTYLDIAHQLEVMEIIANVNKKFRTTIIMVLHDINHARLYSDEVLIVKNRQGQENFRGGRPEKNFIGANARRSLQRQSGHVQKFIGRRNYFSADKKFLTAQMLGEVFNVKADTFKNSSGDTKKFIGANVRRSLQCQSGHFQKFIGRHEKIYRRKCSAKSSTLKPTLSKMQRKFSANKIRDQKLEQPPIPLKFSLDEVQIDRQENQSRHAEKSDNQRVNERYLYRDKPGQIHEPQNRRADNAVPNYLERQLNEKYQRGKNQYARD